MQAFSSDGTRDWMQAFSSDGTRSVAQISMGRGDNKKHGNSSTNTVVTPVEPCDNLHVRQLLSNGEGRVLLDREVV